MLNSNPVTRVLFGIHPAVFFGLAAMILIALIIFMLPVIGPEVMQMVDGSAASTTETTSPTSPLAIPGLDPVNNTLAQTPQP